MITRLRYPKGYQFFDGNGAPLALGTLAYYVAGTTTPQDTYSDSAGTVPNTNPIVLDASGRLDVDVYLGSSANYKEVLITASATVSPWPDDNIPLATQPDWNAASGPSQILNKPSLAAVATSGSYTDLSNTPATNAPFTGDSGSGGRAGLVPAPAAGDATANKFLSAAGGWATPPGSSSSGATNLTLSETAASVAIGSSTGTGVTIPAATSSAAGVLDSARAAKIDGLATVAVSGSYPDLANKPGTMSGATGSANGLAGFVPAPAAGQQGLFLRGDATWAAASGGSSATNLSASETSTSVTIASSTGTGATIPAATSSAAGVLDSARAVKIDGLAAVATSGSYTDLANKPSIPSIPSALASQNIDNVARLGINTTDTGNALSVNAPSVLFSNSGDIRATLSKGSASNVAAFNLQNNFSSRAQLGLLGNDSFTIATSSNGSTFNNALVANSSGAVSFPNTGGFAGATSTAAGGGGLVPAPSAGQQNYLLEGGGSWVAQSALSVSASQVSGLSSVATTGSYNSLSNLPSLGSLAALSALPAPSATTLGGVQSATGSSGQFMTGIGTSGAPQFGTPAYSQISGTPSLGALAPLNAVPLGTSGSGGVTGALPIANGGTGQTSANAAFNALSPMTAAGDLIYGGTSGAAARLAAPSAANPLIGGTTPGYAPEVVYSATGSNWTITPAAAGVVPLKLNLYRASDQIVLVGGNAADGTQFKLGCRPNSLTSTVAGVPYFSSANANEPGVFDIFPNGTPTTPYAAWQDICDTDLTSASAYHSLKCAIGAGKAEIGADAGVGQTPYPLQVCGNSINFQSQVTYSPSGQSTISFGSIGNVGWKIGSGNSTAFWMYSNVLRMAGNTNISWTSDANDPYGSMDTGMARAQAGVISLVSQGGNNCQLTIPSVTYANLPSGVAVGTLATVSDANVTFGTVSSGGGSNKVPVWYNGSSWQVLGGTSGFLSSNTADQTISGGANVTTYQNTGTTGFTVDCGKCPQQYWANNNGAQTLTAPANDGSCILDIENGASAGAITLSGFTKIYWTDSSAGSGTSLSDTANGHTFRLTITRNRGRSFATIQAGQ